MARIVVLQICAAFLVSFVSLLLANDVVGMSALLGGFYHDVHWLAFLVGFVLVMKSYFILLFRS